MQLLSMVKGLKLKLQFEGPGTFQHFAKVHLWRLIGTVVLKELQWTEEL